jgi:hypothetical protein
LRTSTVIVTPKIAAQMLTKNARNRPIKRSVVETYKDAMINEAWEETGEAIKFSASGRLIDGQHRLTALAELDGVVDSLPLLVIKGLTDEAQKKMDRGSRRNVGDELAMNGVSNSQLVAGTVRTILLVKSGMIFTGNGTDQKRIGNASEQDILKYVDDNPGVVGFAAANGFSVGKVVRKRSLFLGGLWLIDETGHERTEEFRDKFTTGSMLGPGNPVLTLRERMFAMKTDRAVYADKELLFMLMRAWVGFRDGEVLTKLQLPKGGVTPANWIDPK